MEGEKGRVCVTGGTGFIASWLVMKLLQHGYSVNATIRSHPQSKKDISYLTNLPGASDRLQIFKADLSEPQSFDAAIEGCIGVFHVAHPVDFEEGEPQETVIRRSVEGTLGILKGCLKSKTVKRVVYTSSTAAVVYNNKDEDIMDESSWSDIDMINSIKPLGSSYVISKTRIERAALEFAEQHGLDLVSLIPSFVVGPFICPGFPGSVHLILAMILGGTGFIASWLIMKLLQHGYSVNATIRSHPGSKKDISYITNLPGASEKLQIFNADLSEPHSFEPALEGCIGVFHVAHPVDFEAREPEETVTRRSVEGTLAILKACLNSKTVKRVVYTSSASAVEYNDKGGDIKDESSWSDVDFLKALNYWGQSYMISKTITERAALDFAQEHGLDLVTVIPSFVVGPFICPRFPGSVNTALALVLGDQQQYHILMSTSMVHVDDVCSAHIFLLEYPDAKGRYICSSDRLTLNEMSEFLSAKYPQLPIPTKDSLKEIKGYRTPGVSSKKLLDTGFKYKYGLDEMFDEAIQCCKEKGFL